MQCENTISISQANSVLSVAVNISSYLTYGGRFTSVILLKNEGGSSESNLLTISMYLYAHDMHAQRN